jgi:ABC-type glycerol-3-phosphate transport system permease component
MAARAGMAPGAIARSKTARIALFIPLIAYTLFTTGPFLWTLILSIRKTRDIYINPLGLPEIIQFDQYAKILREFGFLQYFRNSFIVTVGALALITLTASMASFVLARRRYSFRLREPLFMLIFMAIMLPPQVMVLSLYQLMVKYHLYNTLQGLILVYAATELPLAIYLLRAFYAQIPTELEDAALLDGCSDFSLFWRVMFPIAKPAVATVLVLNLIRYWNEYLYASVLITNREVRTIPLATVFLLGENYADLGMLAAGLVISSLPIVVLYIFLSESFIEGMTAGALKA